MKLNKYIEIVRSEVPLLSSMGQKSADMIQNVLAKHYQTVKVTAINNQEDLDLLVERRPDLVFLGVKSVPTTHSAIPKRIWLSEYLDEQAIAYTGSRKSAIKLEFNKNLAKEIVQAAGLPTAQFFTALPNQYSTAKSLPLSFPLFVKPPHEGGGKGIDELSVVRNMKDLSAKIQEIYKSFRSDSLIETYLTGREFSVAILDAIDGSETLVMPVELLTSKNRFGDHILGQQIKAADTEQVVPVDAGEVRQVIIDLARKIYDVLGARDYGRIDIRMDANNNPYFLEANLIPGLAEHDFTSYFTSACRINTGMSHSQMILRIARLGLRREPLKLAIYPTLIPA
ncbi:MAG: hypothetical protein NVS1B7_6320 [Candidatus Saccharimonadales bacterium]